MTSSRLFEDETPPKVGDSPSLEAEGVGRNNAGSPTANGGEGLSTFVWAPDLQVCWFPFFADEPWLMDPSPPTMRLARGRKTNNLRAPSKGVNLMAGGTSPLGPSTKGQDSDWSTPVCKRRVTLFNLSISSSDIHFPLEHYYAQGPKPPRRLDYRPHGNAFCKPPRIFYAFFDQLLPRVSGRLVTKPQGGGVFSGEKNCNPPGATPSWGVWSQSQTNSQTTPMVRGHIRSYTPLPLVLIPYSQYLPHRW